MTSQLRGVRRFRRTSKTPMDIRPAFESLENRVLLSGLPSNETAYMRFNGTGANFGPWIKVDTLDRTSSSSFEFSAPLDTNTGVLLPAVQSNKAFASADIRIAKTEGESSKVVTAEQISAVAVKSLDLAGSGTQKVTEDATISFAGLKLTTIQASVPTPAPHTAAKGPFDIVLTGGNGKPISSQSSSNLQAFRIADFNLSLTAGKSGKPTGQFTISKTFDQTGSDLATELANNQKLASIELFVQEAGSTTVEQEAFQINTPTFQSVHWNNDGNTLSESISFSINPASLVFKLNSSSPITPIKEPAVSGPIASFLQLNATKTGTQGRWNELTSFDLAIGTPSITVEAVETYTGTPKAGQVVTRGQTFATAALSVANTDVHVVKGEFTFSNVKITAVTTSKSGSKTVENFTFTASTVLVQFFPKDVPADQPAGLATWGEVHDD